MHEQILGRAGRAGFAQTVAEADTSDDCLGLGLGDVAAARIAFDSADE